MQTMNAGQYTVYEMSISYQIELAAHSLSNSGSSSIRLLPRRQLLADGTEVDALSGNISKHYHSELLTEYLIEMGISLCPACARRDGRRAAALNKEHGYEDLGIDRILRECAGCDTHGFLKLAKNVTIDAPERKNKYKEDEEASFDLESKAGQMASKHSVIEYSFGLALPELQTETPQLFTRQSNENEAKMLIKRSARSGRYAFCIRYKCVGVGVDTNTWKVIVTDENERIERHRAILLAFRDCVLSPSGAVTATMLPHLTGLKGAIVLQNTVGRAPYYSPLNSDFIDRLAAMENGSRRVLTFDSVDRFSMLMDELIEASRPALPAPIKLKVSPERIVDENRRQE